MSRYWRSWSREHDLSWRNFLVSITSRWYHNSGTPSIPHRHPL